MARAHGRILSRIWDDSDFTSLDPQEQWLYLFLISQPNLNHAGLLPLTIRRWSAKAAGLTPAIIRDRLAVLETGRFVLVDDDTEELLIRTFVRNDGVWRMPKVMGAMVSGAQEISSRKLRQALLAEIDRIPLDELSDEPGPRLPSVRHQVQEHISTLRRAFGPVQPTPPKPSRNPSGTPSDTPAEPLANPSGGVSEAPAEPSTRAHDARGHAGASRAHSPAPAPTPAPVRESAGASEAEPSKSSLSEITADWQPDFDDIRAAQAARTAQGRPVLTGAELAEVTRKFIRRQLADQRAAPSSGWGARWQEWAERERTTDTTAQPSLLLGIDGGARFPHERPPAQTAQTPTPPSYRDAMARHEAAIAADQTRDTA